MHGCFFVLTVVELTPSQPTMAAAQHIYQNIRVYWLAFVTYWGIVLFGYDTGIAGGVVSQTFFQHRFGLVNTDGTINIARSNEVSSNVVSVSQAGPFFGALISIAFRPRLVVNGLLLGFP